MSKVTKATFDSNLTARQYNANGAQAITGTAGGTTFREVMDSAIWYNQRMKTLRFPEEVLGYPVAEPGSPNDGDIYIQGWCTAPPASCPNVNGEYLDIVQWNATSSVWDTATGFDRTKDYLVYIQGTPVSKGNVWLYSNTDLLSDKWTNLGNTDVFPHNYSIYLQGGTTDEYYHATEEEHNLFSNLKNKNLSYFVSVVDSTKAYGSTTPSGGNAYYLQEQSPLGSNSYLLYYWDSAASSYTAVNLSSYPYNVIVYCESDKHNYMQDRSVTNEIFKDIGKNIAVNHNEMQGLQGGTPTERFHVNAAQFASIGATNPSIYLGVGSVKEVVANVAAISYAPQVNGDYVIVNSEPASAVGEKLYELIGGTWTLQPAITERTEVFNEDDGHVYYYDKNSTSIGAFLDKGVNRLLDHNNAQNIQGGTLTEKYHVDEEVYGYLTAVVQESLTIYIDPNNGDDSNTGLISSQRVKTITRVLAILQGYKIKYLTLDLSSTTSTTFTIGTVLDEYIIKTDLKYISFIGSGKVITDASVTVINGSVASTVLTSLNDISTALASGYYIIDDSPFVGNAGILTNGGSTANEVFVTPKHLTNGVFDIKQYAVTVDFGTGIVEFEGLSLDGLRCNLSTSVTRVRELSLNDNIIEFGNLTVNEFTANNSLASHTSLIVNNNAVISKYVNAGGSLINYGLISIDGIVLHHDNIVNYGTITNVDQNSDSVMAFLNHTNIFDSKKGSKIRMIDVTHLLLINSDSIHLYSSGNEKFDNVLTYTPADGKESDNDSTYVLGIDSDELYNSNECNSKVDIGLLRHLSNHDHIRRTGVTIPLATATVASTFDIGNFIANSAIKLKVAVEDTVGTKHYYKDIHIVLDDSGPNTVVHSLSGVDNSTNIDETSGNMFLVGVNRLSLLLVTTSGTIDCNIDVEIERIMR